MKLFKKTWSDFYGEDTKFIDEYMLRNHISKEDEQLLFAAFKAKLGFVTLKIFLKSFLNFVGICGGVTVFYFIICYSNANKDQIAYMIKSLPFYIFTYIVLGLLLLIVQSKLIEYDFLIKKKDDFEENVLILNMQAEYYYCLPFELEFTLWIIFPFFWFMFLIFQKEIIKFIIFVKELIIQYIMHADFETIILIIFIVLAIIAITVVYNHAKNKATEAYKIVRKKVHEG